MRVFSAILLGLCIFSIAGFAQSKGVQDYIGEARQYKEAGDLEKAIEVMREAVGKYPEDPDAHALLGLYVGQSAGETEDFRIQAGLAFESFELLDTAVSLDSINVYARFYRGLVGVKVPEFLGKRDQAIEDLRLVLRIGEREPGKVSDDMLVTAYSFLAEVYEERGETEEAIAAWKEVIELAPESEIAERARESVARLSRAEGKGEEVDERVDVGGEIESEPRNVDEMITMGRTHFRNGDYERAEELLSKAVARDSSNAQAYALLGMVIGMKAGRGYDEEIADDTDLRINLCFRTIEYLDKAVDLAPEDYEIRLMRGVIGVNLPFFVGKLDQGIADLNNVIESSAPDSLKAEALYHLGVAHRKKSRTHWVKIVTDYPESQVAQWVFESMRPQTERIDLSKYDIPIVVVDFVLGFEDEVPPQTAVWVEDEKGMFVRTLHVSGFAGNVGDGQVTLPKWGESSKFETDATTAASIDMGHCMYVWDLKAASGKEIASGGYTINVEVSYWPSMQYQVVSAFIEVGGKEKKVKVEEENLIPLLEVRYLPRGRK